MNRSQEALWLLEEKYKGVESEAFHADLKRLASGEPLAYIIGSIPFLNCTIFLDSHPLIPRPETEFWVEKAIAEIQKHRPADLVNERHAAGGFGLGDAGASESSLQAGASERGPATTVSVFPRNEHTSVLDLCAGSGAIGIAVAKALPDVHVEFGEIEKAHLATIGKNLDANGISCTCYKVWQSDLFENIQGTFDFILSNPPYIDPAVDRAEASVKMHEPHIALYGGEAGMELIARIIVDAASHLRPDGQLWIEHEPEQSEAIAVLATQNGYTISTHNDQYEVSRYSVLRMAQ